MLINTYKRENDLKSKGYKLVTIWEHDWKKIESGIVKNILLNNKTK